MSVWKRLTKWFLNCVCTLRCWALGSLRRTYRALPIVFVLMASVFVLSTGVSLALVAIQAAKLVQLVGIEITIAILKSPVEMFLTMARCVRNARASGFLMWATLVLVNWVKSARILRSNRGNRRETEESTSKTLEKRLSI